MSLEVNDQFDFFKQVKLNSDGKLVVNGLSGGGGPSVENSYVLHSTPEFNILKTTSEGTSLVNREITGIYTDSYTSFQISSLYYDIVNDLLFAGLAGSSVNGSIWKSIDRGLTWSVVGPVDPEYVSKIDYNGDVYVAVGGSTTEQYGYYSPDGDTWTINNLLDNRDIRDVCYGSGVGLWVAVGGASSAPYISSSPDGIVWTTRTDPWSVNREIWCIAYSPTLLRYVMGSKATTNGNPFGYSDNGTSWTEVTVAGTTIGNCTTIIWDPINELFIAAGYTATTNYVRMIYSADGINWSVGTGYDTIMVASTSYFINFYSDTVNNKIVAFNGYHSFESTDGIAWTQIIPTPFSMYITAEPYKNNFTYLDLSGV